MRKKIIIVCWSSSYLDIPWDKHADKDTKDATTFMIPNEYYRPPDFRLEHVRTSDFYSILGLGFL